MSNKAMVLTKPSAGTAMESTAYDGPLSAVAVRQQIQLIQEIMHDAMKPGEHYGTIPGCGDKPTLLKAGAEKLNLTFRMAPTFDVDAIDLDGGHREYRVICKLQSITSGMFLGEGLGSASTMETKWRYRSGPVEFTGKPVPKEYWDSRDSSLLGGKGFVTKKNPDTGQWEIARQGEKVEHDNPADNYNTCLKMAKKRAHVDAVLTVTAASDIFTQDIEEMAENGNQPAASARITHDADGNRSKAQPEEIRPEVVYPGIIQDMKQGKGKNGRSWTKAVVQCDNGIVASGFINDQSIFREALEPGEPITALSQATGRRVAVRLEVNGQYTNVTAWMPWDERHWHKQPGPDEDSGNGNGVSDYEVLCQNIEATITSVAPEKRPDWEKILNEEPGNTLVAQAFLDTLLGNRKGK